jgi:hypothetical protein
MVSEYPEMTKQCTVGKRNHVAVMISQQLELMGLKIVRAKDRL